jgi:hypothetical protein
MIASRPLSPSGEYLAASVDLARHNSGISRHPAAAAFGYHAELTHAADINAISLTRRYTAAIVR